jgi:hypothetical protein
MGNEKYFLVYSVVQSVDELHYKPEVGRSIAHRVSEVSY